MAVVTMEEANERIEELAELAASGELARITQNGGPPLTLTPVAEAGSGRRVFGAWAGQVRIKDDFDDPMPDDWLDLFHNGPVFPDENEPDRRSAAP